MSYSVNVKAVINLSNVFLANTNLSNISTTFGQELAVLHTLCSMLGEFAVQAGRSCGGLNEEHSISVH